MKKKKQHQEEHVDEAWLLPYADMLTLLLALFIVMFAMSQVDKEKLQKAAQQFNTVFAGGGRVLQNDGNKAVSLERAPLSNDAKSIAEQDAMVSVKNELEEEIKASGYADKIQVDIDSEGLHISIQDTVLFGSGDAQILDKFYPLLTQISNMIKPLNNDIGVAGHTDNVPIKNNKYPSNWELSSARSLNVIYFMTNNAGISPDKFSIHAFGQYKPKFDNSTDEGRAKNRRVELIVMRKYQIDEKIIK